MEHARGGAGQRDAVLGAHAWAYMRRDPDYRADWEAHGAPPLYEDAGFPLRVQSAPSGPTCGPRRAGRCWPGRTRRRRRGARPSGRACRCWSASPTRSRGRHQAPAPLLPLLAAAGARVEGLRLLDGRFVLKAELGNALLQIMVPSGRAFGPDDGIMAKLGLALPLEAVVGRVEDLWRATGRPPPPRRRRARARRTRSF